MCLDPRLPCAHFQSKVVGGDDVSNYEMVASGRDPDARHLFSCLALNPASIYYIYVLWLNGGFKKNIRF